MKLTLAMMILALMASCGHMKKKEVPSYNPVISFMEGKTHFEANVGLPKDMKDKVPLVVIVHEWWGRNDFIARRASALHQAGYATLPVDLFGDSKSVSTPSEAMALATPLYKNPQLGIDRLQKYIKMAKKDPHVDANKVFVIGYCFGGTQALHFARVAGDVAGVVSFHGGLEAGVPVEKITARILALNGLADPMVPAKQRDAFEKEMKAAGADYKIVNYPNAMHAFTNPSATEKGKRFKLPVAYNEEADKASWKELMEFLKK